MSINTESYSSIAEQLKENYSKLSDFERLSLAIQIERNLILEKSLGVNTGQMVPSFLEAIAMSLGYSNDQIQSTVADYLKALVQKE